MKSPRVKLKTISQSVRYLSLCGALMAPALLPTVSQAETVQTQQFNIAAGDLGTVLNRFAAKANVVIFFDAAITRGKRSSGLSGQYTTETGLQSLLSGSGLGFVKSADGSYQIKANDDSHVNLGTVSVSASAWQSSDGSVETGYLADNVSGIGPWQGRSLQDTPYSISVMSKDLIENAASGSLDQLFKLNPVVQNMAPFTVFGYPSVAIRGFNQSQGIFDGIKLSNYTYGLNTEELERVEVLNGLSGFMYGAGNVGGAVNYVLKRPVYERLTNVTVGNYGHEQWFGHVDLSDKIDEDGIFAYRLNMAYSNGETAKKGQEIEKKLISGALDWNVSDKLLIQFDAAYSEFNNNKPDTRFYSSGIDYWPDAFDNEETYTPDWNYNDTETKRLGTRATWDINDTFTVRSAYIYKKDRREHIINYPIFTENGWTLYNPAKTAPYEITSQGAYAYLDSVFNTGWVDHKVTIGASADTYKEEQHENRLVRDSSDVPPVNLTLDELLNMPKPDYLYSKDYGRMYKSSEVTNTNLIISDDITFNKQWSALVGFNYATIKSKSFSAVGETTADYDKSATTPTLSLIYKPIENMSFYISYIEGLEKGTTVSDDSSLYNNPGKIFEPYISKQYEIGNKFMIAENLMLNTALFRLEKANSNSEVASNGKITVSQDGEQIHEGLEVTLTGKLTDNLTVITGGTLMDLSVEKASNADIEGKKPVGVASKMAKIYTEYAIPQIHGLVLTGGAYYTGEKYKNSSNTQKVDGYTLLDIGARYTTKLSGNNVTFNLNLNNLTNEDYWASEWQLGIPRTLSFSMKTEF